MNAAKETAVKSGEEQKTEEELNQGAEEQEQELTPAEYQQKMSDLVRERKFSEIDELDPDKDPNAPPAEGAEKPAEGDGQAAGTDDGVEGEAAAAAAAAPAEDDKTVFKSNYGSEAIEADDKDGFLGRGTLEALKKKALHGERHVEQLVNDNAVARTAADEAIRNYNTMKEEVERLKAHKPAAAAPPQKTEEEKASEAAQTAARNDIGAPPDLPKSKYDPDTNSAEEVAEWQTYFQDNNVWQGKITEAMKSAPVPAKVDKSEYEAEIERRVQERVAPMEERMNKVESSFSTIQQTNQKTASDTADKQMWKGFQTFQSDHETFKTESSLEQIHKEVGVWSDRVAKACGVELPFGATADQRTQYVNKRQQLVQSYLDNDSPVVEKVKGIDPPDGYDKYYQIAEINRIAQDKGLDLEDALAVHMRRAGTMDSSLESIRTEAEQTGREDVGRAFADGQRLAKPIPNDIAQRTTHPTEKTPEAQAAIVNMDPREIIGDPEKMREFEEYGKQKGWK